MATKEITQTVTAEVKITDEELVDSILKILANNSDGQDVDAIVGELTTEGISCNDDELSEIMERLYDYKKVGIHSIYTSGAGEDLYIVKFMAIKNKREQKK